MFSRLPLQHFKKPTTLLFTLLILAHILFSLFINPKGEFTPDGFIYRMMVKNFYDRGALDTWNGYDELQVPPLTFLFHHAGENKIYPQYPSLYPILAYPFYASMGFYGLFVINMLSFLAASFFCYSIAQKLFKDRTISITATLILSLGTFFWTYAEDDWPHALNVFLVTVSFWYAVRAFETHQRPWRYAFLAGLILGISIGVRIDSFLALPAFFLAFFLAYPLRAKELLAFCFGYLPGMLFLSYTNHIKFNTWLPLSYGKSYEDRDASAEILSTSFAVLGSLGLTLLLITWILVRLYQKDHFRLSSKTYFFAILVATALITLVFPEQVKVLMTGFAGNVFDLRFLYEGGLDFFQHFKKALLQSCPYFVIALYPLFALKTFPKPHRYSIVWLYIIPASYVVFYSYFKWHGGLSYSMRYLLPILPFLSILCAYALVSLKHTVRFYKKTSLVVLAAILKISIPTLLIFVNLTNDVLAFYYLTFPLLLASVTFVALCAFYYLPLKTSIKNIIGITLFYFIAFGLLWSIWMTFFYDYPILAEVRKTRIAQAAEIAPFLEDNALLMHYDQHMNVYYGLLEYDKHIRLAWPKKDEYASFHKLVTFYLDKNIAVYSTLSGEEYNLLKSRNALEGLEFIPLFNGFVDLYKVEYSNKKRPAL